MKMKTGLLVFGLLGSVVVATASCSSDSGDSNGTGATSTGGSTAGNGTSGNGTSGNATAGSNNNGGTNNNTAGTNNNNGGNNNGGTNNNNGGGGPDNNGGGGPDNNQGGAGNGAECPDAVDGETCTRMGGFQNACVNGNDELCQCQRMGQGQDAPREWNCNELNGGGGAPGGFNDAMCGDAPEDDGDCTGQGPCPGAQGCFCFNETVNCF